MNNKSDTRTFQVCRTCMEEITNTSSYFHLNSTEANTESTIRQKLFKCIPELDLSIIPNAIICNKCTDTINSIYKFKNECLQLELQIHKYIQQLQDTDSLDFAKVAQFCRNYRKLRMNVKSEDFEVIENFKIEDSTSGHCDDNGFNATDDYTEIIDVEYLTSLQKVDIECVLFNTVDNFIDNSKSDVEENSDTSENSDNCSLQVIENQDVCIQNLHKIDIYYQCYTCGHKAESKSKLIIHLKNHLGKKLHKNSRKNDKIVFNGYRCYLCNYLTKCKCIFDFHIGTHLTKNCKQILKRKHNNSLIDPIAFNKRSIKNSKRKCAKRNCNKYISKNHKSFRKYSKANRDKMGTSKVEDCFTCPVCNYQCTRKWKHHITCHMRIHTGEKPYKCSFCEYRCINKSGLTRHMLTHTNEKPFSCSLCNYRCKRKSHLCLHMLTHTGERPFSCSICEYRFRDTSHLKRHLLVHTGEKPFTCLHCKYQCNNKDSLKIHLRVHMEEKPLACANCEYRCKSKSLLKCHMRIHAKKREKPFRCSICDFRFIDKSKLKKHLETHTGEKSFTCSVCNHRCNNKSNLKRHIQTHTGERPFKCAICGKRFGQKENLKSHMRIHTGEKPYNCSICEYSCNNTYSLKLHMRKHTGEKPFRCSTCDYQSAHNCNMKHHMQSHL